MVFSVVFGFEKAVQFKSGVWIFPDVPLVN